MPETRLILHIKGTEEQTTELPKQVVRAAISQGQITHSQLIWSPTDNAWKQVRELPHLLPSQKLAPAPTRVPTSPLPKVVVASQTGPVPKVSPKATAPAKTKATGKPVEKGSLVVEEEDHGSHPLKWICMGVGALIVVILAINYFLVNRPLISRFSGTPYANVMIYGHLGAFMQPRVLVIHIPANATLTPENLTSFLVALAHSTPEAPLSGNLFERVALTSDWEGQYSFSGYAWKQLGDMAQDDEAQRKEFILAELDNAGGTPLASTTTTLSEVAQQAQREKVWQSFVEQFVKKN